MGSQAEGAMENCTVKVNETEVATKDSGKTVVNVNITQESSLAYLFKAVAAMRRPKPASKAPEFSSADTPPARTRCNGEQKVLGAAQILLGLLCISLGIVLALGGVQPWEYGARLLWNGIPFWMGSAFILSGIFSVVGERRGGGWVHLATLFNLASVVAGTVALTMALADIPDLTNRPSYISDLCNKRTRQHDSWEPTQRPSDDDGYDATRAEDCKERMWQLVTISNSIHLLLLLLSLAALGIALFGVGYGLRVLCCSCQRGCEDYVAIRDPEVPPSCEDPEKEKVAA